jgi:hypothetical protein
LNAPIALSADATDLDGTISQVEFFANSTSLGALTNPPYAIVVSNLAAGNINLTARATDDRGGITTSSTITIVIVSPPTVILTQPTNGALVQVGSTVALQATGMSVGGTITNIQFFAGASSLGTATSPPFSVNWSPTSPGPVTLVAIAEDDLGQTSTSVALLVRAFLPDDIRPTLRITEAPANFARLKTPAIAISGTAADNVGLDRVEFQFNQGAFTPAAGTTSWEARLQLSPGMNTVGIRAIDLAGNSSTEIFRYFMLVANSRLALQIVGSGTVTPALGGQLLEVGKAYRLIAQPGLGQVFAGWSGGITNSASSQLSFQMRSNLQLTATFVSSPFVGKAGNYAGLVLNTNSAYPANSAAFNLQLGSQGAFSGKLMMNGRAYPFTGRFDLQGSAKAAVVRHALNPVLLTMTLGLDPATNSLTGSATDGTWNSPLAAVRTTFGQSVEPGPQGARRAFGLKSSDTGGVGATANCVAQISNAGSVDIRGVLSDGRAFASVSPISADGQIPLYDSFNRGSELLAGWIHFDLQGNAAPSGEVIWSAATTNGFSEVLEVTPQ